MTTTEFEIIVNDLSKPLYRFAYMRMQREDLAQDVVQECMVKLWNEEKPFKHYLNVKAYCITLVKNKCIDYLRAEKTRKNYESLNQGGNVNFNIEDTLEREEKLKIMNEYLNKINEKQASALKLRDFEGYSYLEIADILGETESNIKVLIFRGRNALMKLLKKRNGLQSTAY